MDNFHILFHRNESNLHLKLFGEFDGSSAFQLIKTLKENTVSSKTIFIHTSGLKDVHPFGRGIFEKHFPQLTEKQGRFIFTGKYSSHLSQN